MAVGPGTPVEPLPASPPRVSLLSMATLVPNAETDTRWMGGIRYAPEECLPETDSVWWQCSTDDPGFEKESGAGNSIEEFTPMVAWAGDSCSPFGWNERDFQGRARRKLLACESRIIEAELWTGAHAADAGHDTNRFLEDGSLVEQLEGGVKTGYVSALAELEQALAECSCGGGHMIHAQPRVVTTWSQNGLLTLSPDGTMIRTAMGTLVVPGAGYPGTGPDGEPDPTADRSWAYATGIVRVWRGPISIVPGTLGEAMDRDTNLVTYRAERTFAAVWDQCCHVGIHVDLCQAHCETGS